MEIFMCVFKSSSVLICMCECALPERFKVLIQSLLSVHSSHCAQCKLPQVREQFEGYHLQ